MAVAVLLKLQEKRVQELAHPTASSSVHVTPREHKHLVTSLHVPYCRGRSAI